MAHPDPGAAPRLPLRRARWAARAQFTVLGVLVGAWGAHIPSVKSRYQLDEASLSLALLVAATGAVGALLIAGRCVGRFGARRSTLLSGLTMAGALSLVLQLPNLAALLPAVFLFGAGSSVFDVAINAEGSELEQLGRRSIMSNLHAMFSVGGMLGAASVAALLGAGVAAPTQLTGLAAALALCLGAASRAMLPPAAQPDPDAAHFAWPRGTLLVIGLLILAGMVAEGVMYDWCVLFLKQEIGLPQPVAALGYAAFAGAMAISRFGGDWLRERFSERALLQSGATLAALAMTAVLLISQPGVALVGFALVGAGLAPVAPILYNAATRVPGVSRAAAIASVSSIGYGGFMLGPPLVGSLAHASSLTAALGVVVFSALLLAGSARWVPVRR